MAGLLATALFPSCLKEMEPTAYATQGEVDRADKSYLANGISAYLNIYSGSYNYDIGFMANNIWRDASTADAPVYNTAYDYFTEVTYCYFLGSDWAWPSITWERYYGLIKQANLVIGTVDPDNNEIDKAAVTSALAYRANAYLELAQWFEYKKTGIASLDEKAEASNIIGLTVPIVTEATTETESRHNPRMPFYTMYRFILTDLNRGEKYSVAAAEPASKADAGKGVIYGLQARLWLLMGTRFDRHPDDLASALAHESDADIPYDALGISTARDCFAKAAEYARKAINCGYTPVSESEWFNPSTGFNTPTSSWMWADIISANDGLATTLVWSSWVSFMSPEATYGVSSAQYGSYRMIDARLYESIPDADWRKTTWIDPDDVGSYEAYKDKYSKGTSLSYAEWAKFANYASFKFHPGSGDGSTSTIGNVVSTPMMRVEEMYLIEAEATGRASGDAAGRALLETFVNNYRYTNGSYKSTGAGLDGFIDDVFTQKRIELWGEGQILWDYRRLEKAVVRGYPGTNHPASTQFNSLPNYVAPWSTVSIPKSEHDFNESVILNPDPSAEGNYSVWSGE